MKNEIKNRYESLDGLRVISMLLIVILHVYANVDYRNELNLPIISRTFGDFTELFFYISAFSICCGYYEKISNGGGSLNEIGEFYKRRIKRIFPLFICLSIVDVIINPEIENVYELIANASLLFGLIPNQNISVIGVGWTLGVLVIFYLLFPFFVWCMKSKKRIGILYIIGVYYHFISNKYFLLGKHDFLFSMIYFVSGCILYMLRDKIEKINKTLILIICLILLVLFFRDSDYHQIIKYVFFTSLMVYCIKDKNSFLSNNISKKLSKYSLDIYLLHMPCFRVIEKANLESLFSNDFLKLTVSTVIVFVLTVTISYLTQKLVINCKRVYINFINN